VSFALLLRKEEYPVLGNIVPLVVGSLLSFYYWVLFEQIKLVSCDREIETTKNEKGRECAESVRNDKAEAGKPVY
jgi:hypothetical protein